MAAHESRSPNDKAAFVDDDEDLFDFPRVELTQDGLRDVPASQPQDVSAPSSLAAAPAPLPAARAVNSTPHPLSRGPEPTPAVVAVETRTPVVERAAAKPALEEPAAEKPASQHRGRGIPRLRLTRVALIALFVLNGAGFWFLWRTHVSFGAGIDNLRTELDDAAKRLERARRETGSRAIPTPFIDEEPTLDPLDALERSSLVQAENEIKVGEYGAARRRLNRMLAQADRMNPSLRAEIEPRAAFLVAQSYQDEASARRRSPR